MSYVERPAATLRQHWRIVARRKWIVIAALVVTIVPAMVYTILQDPVYQGSADMLIRSQPDESLFGSGNRVYVDPDRVVQNEISVLEGKVVYAKVIENLGLEAAPPEVNGRSHDFTDLITVEVESGDPETATVLANAYVDAYIDVKREQSVAGLEAASKELETQITRIQLQIEEIDGQIARSANDDDSVAEAQRRGLVDQQLRFRDTYDQLQIDAALSSGSAELVRPAEVPVQPIAPRPTRTALLAITVGLLIGLAGAWLIDHLDDSIGSPEDLSKLGSDVPLLAVLPIENPPDHRPISLSNPELNAVEPYRALLANVQFLEVGRPMRVIQVTSSLPGEGKTTTATNLAVVLAQTGVSVLVVDADLRKPRVQRAFGVDGTLGLTNNLVGETIEITIQPLSEHLSVLSSGPVPPNPSEMLSSQGMISLIDGLRQRFDYVILDSPPTLSVSDAVALSRHVDGVLVVIQAGRASLPHVAQTLRSLEQVGAPVIGFVLNKAPRNVKFAYGYAYG
jgi:polysaccharide biosynthesis transport protein